MNTGIFLTKSGVTKPTVTEMSLTTWNAYASNRKIGILQNGYQIVEAFEAFKYKAGVNQLGAGEYKFSFNSRTDFIPQFVTGTGSIDPATGKLTFSTAPVFFQAANQVFLKDSHVGVDADSEAAKPLLAVESIDGASHIRVDWATDTIVPTLGGVAGTSVPLVTVNDARIEVGDTEIRVHDNTDTEIYTLPRTYKLTLISGLAGVVFESSGAAVGGNVPFGSTDTIDAGAIASGTGVIQVESNFGQVTQYDVAVNAPLTVSGGVGDGTEVTGEAGDPLTVDTAAMFSGGVGELKYSVTQGQLPAGLTLSPTGVITGTPQTDGEAEATIKVEDLTGASISLPYKFKITPKANVNFNPNPAIEGVPYSYNPQIPGITAATVVTGTLPPGLTLNATSGALSGTPSQDGNYSYTVSFTVSGANETIAVAQTVYQNMAVEVFSDGSSDGLVASGGSTEVQVGEVVQLVVSGGSGQFQYAASGDAYVSSNGAVQVFSAGETMVTVTDVLSGQIVYFSLLVAGQTSICGVAVEAEASNESSNAPCVDVITDCNTPVTIAFPTLHILKGVDVGDTPYREYPDFVENEGSTISNDGKAFAMFQAVAPYAFAVADNAKDGKGFIVEFAANSTLVNGTMDAAIGVSRKWNKDNRIAGLDFAVVISSVSGTRSVEIRASNVYQAGSRFQVVGGQQIGFAVFGDSVHLYIDGLLKYSLTGATYACAGMDLVLFAEQVNTIFGGRATEIVFSIDTTGNPAQVGTIDPQSGLYTPAVNNVSLVKIKAASTLPGGAFYTANVRVIKAAMKQSFERAMQEGQAVDMWIANLERFDDLPLRLDREGRPDKNQVSDPLWLGVLQGSGRIESTLTRNEFRNDRGATSTSLTIDKVIVTGAMLIIRDFEAVKRVVPYMRETNSHGVRTLKQYSTGCPKKMRVFMIWRSPDCEDVPVWDAIEVVNGTSYTPFNMEVGQGVQSNIPISIEGFPDSNGLIYDYNQYDKAFHRIGEQQ